MPRVPSFGQQTVQSQGLPNARVSEQVTDFSPLAQGISTALGVANGIIQDERDKADNAAVIEAETALDGYENDALFNPETGAFTKKGKDSFDLPNQVLPSYDDQVRKLGDALGSDRAKLAFKQRAARRRTGIDRQLNQHEGQQREGYYDQQDVAGLKSSQSVAANFYNQPTRIAEELSKQDAIIGTMGARKGMSPEQIDEAKRASRSGTHTDVVQRYLSRGEFDGASKYFESQREQIGADDASRIESALTIERRRQAEQAQRDVDRREAKAERTLLDIDRQVASGIPATPEMWKRWGAQVKGTSFDSEYKARIDDEQQVQTLLSKPIDEQVRYIQQKEAALSSGGGSLRDAANVNRLKGAVNQNLQLLNTSPLLFDERRNGTQFQPLTAQQLLTDEGARAISERLTTIDSMRKQYGTSVPVKPLLPQEAAQLTTVLQSSPPGRQVDLLAGMAASFGDQNAFRGAMQQIAPDAPVKAMAGMLANKTGEVTTRSRWFSADETVTGAKVAQTLLEGEAILNPTGSDKKEDGRPKIGLYLPETTLLQQEFQDQVGDAFRGNADAADLAFQAVKSYYVGKAAQTGRVAASKEDVDTKLVSESVTSVLGGVSDYNGAGKVIAPWGMPQHKFEDRATTEFQLAARKAGIPDDQIESLSDEVGLMNIGEDRYAVTTGNNYLLDPRGTPIVIDLKDAKLR